MPVFRKATVFWEKDLLTGNGRVQFNSSGMPEAKVTWAARTDQSDGMTSPEELLAAAHASCLSMSLSSTLAKNGFPPKRLAVTAVATFDKVDDKWRVTKMALGVSGEIEGIEQAKFEELAKLAKDACPISNALKNNVEITLTAVLDNKPWM